MPVYDYLCGRCGPFTDMRPMAEADLAQECPACGKAAPRALLTAPALATMPAERRLAHATNERSASSPKTFSVGQRAHPSGCGCCSRPALRYDKAGPRETGRPAAKSFPARRPWMISH